MAEPILRAPDPAESAAPAAAVLAAEALSVRCGRRLLLRAVGLAVRPRSVLAILGPSGAGKSTLLKCLNRLIDLEPELRREGTVRFHGRSIYGAGVSGDDLRARIGILFQQPVVFPGSVRENVLFGLRGARRLPRGQRPGAVERALRRVALWREVAERLDEPAATLSAGQQQRLCLARTLAVGPEVILMDEPTSSLDPASTAAIEGLILELKRRHAIVLVTHDPAQARRVADEVACLCVRDGAGEIVESGACGSVFDSPRCRETLRFLGREAAP